MAKLGYDDTPMLPDSQWQVHDYRRPQPPVVTPAVEAGAKPSDAITLFDGSDLSGWTGKEGAAKWKVEKGYMEVVPGTGDITSVARIGDCQMHLEFACPEVVKGESQGRGNSGVFMMGLYEIQVLDGYDNPTYADGITASIYGEVPPMANACRKPGEWQTYDIVWTAPRFNGVDLVSPAYLTLLHNGVVVHNHAKLIGPTGHRNVYPYTAHAPAGPLKLQDHGDLVRFRNIWYRPLAT
ncbi:MAG: 3-keto-disaccharide hydrolase [Spirochaetota bacterium]